MSSFSGSRHDEVQGGGTGELDEMLYNVYLKTASLITHNRLTHWHDIDTFCNLQDTYPATTSEGLDTHFGLVLPSLEVFTEELTTWKHMSAFAPAASLRESAERPLDEQQGAKTQMYVPPMILDVILDPSKLALEKERRLTLVKEHQDSPSTSKFIPVESLAQEDSNATPTSTTQRPVILERWRIDFVAFPPDSPPDHDALYREITRHFANFARLARSLPAQKLYQRLRSARIDVEAQSSSTRRSQYNQHDDLLQIGCRLGAGEPSTQPSDNDTEDDADDEIGLKVKLSLSRQSSTGEPGDETEMETSIYGFSPIITAMGSINISVEYRNSIDFQVKNAYEVIDRSVSLGIASAELKPDEDFFRPKPSRALIQDTPSPSSAVSSSRKVSALSALRQHSSPSGTSSPIPQVSTAASSGASSPAPSLFSVSAPGRPVAGLSSLRSQGAMPIAPTTDLAMASGSTTSAISASPGIGEPAFITHGRRPSMSERRFRTLSGLGSDRPSPPSPMNSAGPAVRPAMSSQMRFGSYSPSSPSPLAQQLSGSQAHAQTGAASSSSMAGTSSSALPIHRSSVSESAPKLSLRSIFQDYGPRVPGSRSSIPSPSALRTTFHNTPQRPLMNRTPSGGDDRDSNIAGSSNISGALPGSSSSTTSSTSRHAPSVAPQMIQRYARTPSYRQERRMTGGSIGESEGEHTGGINRGGSSVEGGGSGSGGASGSYSRSWQARTEARQAMIANAMQRGSLGSGASGSPSSIHGKGSPPVFGSVNQPSFMASQRRQSGYPTSSSSPSTASSRRVNRKGSIDEFVSMLESRPQLNSPLSGKRPSPTPTQPPHLARLSGDSEPAFRIHSQPQTSSHKESDLSSGGPNPSSVSPETGSPSYNTSRVLLSRSAVDDMLAKMSLTVSRLASQSVTGSSHALSPAPQSTRPSLQSEVASRPVASARQSHVTVEGGRGARTYEVAVGTSDSSTSRGGGQGGDGLLSTGDATAPRRLTSRSQSSFELSSPDHPHLTLNQRSSSGYDESEADTALLGNYDEEEPAGRLELHSEPSTPHPGGGRSYGGYLSDAPAAGRRQGSDGTETGQNTVGVNTAEPSDGQIEGGFGSLATDPSDAERLRSFGEELGSTRGRRNQSPWEIRRAATPGNTISNATSPVGSAGNNNNNGNGGGGWTGTPYGAFAMRPSNSNPRPLRGAAGRVYPGGGHHFNGHQVGYPQGISIRGQRRSRSGSATASPAVGSPNPALNANTTPESPRRHDTNEPQGDDDDDDDVTSGRPTTTTTSRGTDMLSQTLNRDW